MSNTCTFYVEGMHCAACELLIEKRLKTIENVQSCKASLKNSELKIAYTDSKPTIDSLNEAVKEFGYKFHTSAEKIKQKKPSLWSPTHYVNQVRKLLFSIA